MAPRGGPFEPSERTVMPATMGRSVPHRSSLSVRWCEGHTAHVVLAAVPRDVRPFVGRGSEVEVLSDVVTSDTHVGFLHGIAGIGKSALLKRFLDEARWRA